MKRLIVLMAVMLLAFTACFQEKEVKPKYDLSICDSNLPEIYRMLKSKRSDEYHMAFQDFNKYDLLHFIENASDENLLSITIYSENLSDRQITDIISFVRKRNIPIIFACQNIATDTLMTYDKAFCVTTDYTYAGEVFATKIVQLWRAGEIVDKDENKLFAFSVLMDEQSPKYISTFYPILLKNLEIYGIPLQMNEELYPSMSDISIVVEAEIAENEGVILLDDEMLKETLNYYEPKGSGVEILSLHRGSQNPYIDKSYASICFIDYNDYVAAAAEILENYSNRSYPLSVISYPVSDRTVYISPVV